MAGVKLLSDSTVFQELVQQVREDVQEALPDLGPRLDVLEDVVNGVSPLEFGAKGNYSDDDTYAITQALQKAANDNRPFVIPAGYRFGTTLPIICPPNLKVVRGLGGTIEELPGSSQFGLVSAINHTNLSIEGLIIISHGYSSSYGVFLRNASGCIIRGNTLKGFNGNAAAGILIRSFTGANAPCDNIITANYVEGKGYDILNASSAGIQIDAFGASTAYPNKNIVTSNRVIGFQYGLSLSNAKNTLVTANSVSDCVRAVSMQNDNTVRNHIFGNLFSDCLSAAIHHNHGASDNLTENNYITQSHEGGEAIIQAMNNSKRNRVINNVIIANGLPEYHIYFACNASGNEAIGNQCFGRALKGYIVVESAWEPQSQRSEGAYSIVNRGYKTGVENVATEDTLDVVIKDNVVNGTSNVPAFAFTQYTVAGVVYKLSRLIFKGNQSIGDSVLFQLYMWEDTTDGLSKIQAVSNNFDLDSSIDKYKLPRRGAHFSVLESNTGAKFKTRLVATYTPGGGSIDAGKTELNGFGATGFMPGDKVDYSPVGLQDGMQVYVFIAGNSIGNIRWTNSTNATMATSATTLFIEIFMRATG